MIDTHRPRAWWHGCWLQPGHYLFDEDGRNGRDMEPCPLRTGADQAHWLDGQLAPQRLQPGSRPPPIEPLSGGIVFARMAGDDRALRSRIERASDEAPQGEFLLHAISDCTIAAWWDRTQGDDRGASNSCLVVEGAWNAAEMLKWFPQLFPLQAERLAAAGVELRYLQRVG